VGLKSSEPQPSTTSQTPREDSSNEEESTDGEEEEEEDVPSGSDVHVLSKELAMTSLGPSVDWSKQTSYEPIYLETESEFLPPAPKSKPVGKAVLESSKGGGGDDWGKEMWEDSPNLDGVFVKFTMRLDARPSQCVR
jgi:pre-rRNA-processing protein TSR4